MNPHDFYDDWYKQNYEITALRDGLQMRGLVWGNLSIEYKRFFYKIFGPKKKRVRPPTNPSWFPGSEKIEPFNFKSHHGILTMFDGKTHVWMFQCSMTRSGRFRCRKIKRAWTKWARANRYHVKYWIERQLYLREANA